MSKLEEVREMIATDLRDRIIDDWYTMDAIISDHKEETANAAVELAMDIMHAELGSEFNEDDLDAIMEEEYGSLGDFIEGVIYDEWDV